MLKKSVKFLDTLIFGQIVLNFLTKILYDCERSVLMKNLKELNNMR